MSHQYHADLTGRKFGRLTALRAAGTDKYHNQRWECACECGGTSIVRASSLLRGTTRSCGCIRREVAAGKAFHGRRQREALDALVLASEPVLAYLTTQTTGTGDLAGQLAAAIMQAKGDRL